MTVRFRIFKTARLIALCLLLAVANTAVSIAAPVDFTDALGRHITFDRPPGRVVSLVPAVTEMIFAVGAGSHIAAVTHHDTWPPEAARKPVVGGYFSPSVEAVAAFRPDVIFVSDLHQAVIVHFQGTGVKTICLPIRTLNESFTAIRLIGEIFDRPSAARAVVAGIRDELTVIRKKIAKIPNKNRQRVMRLMGRDRVMTPGDDSFQNDLIRAAGGIPPQMGKSGSVVEVSLEEWRAFNPQALYGCGGDRQAARATLDRTGWRDVDAVKNGRIFYFPCALTCRAATHTGRFAAWLSARIYTKEFGVTKDQVYPDAIFKSRTVEIGLPYIKKARVVYSRIHDFVNKTLMVDFKQPMRIVSTLEGQRDGIQTVGNHYSPAPCWGIGHADGLDKVRDRIYTVIGASRDTDAYLFTGADMDNLSIQRRAFKDMAVVALVTAGVQSNAVRMSKDIGSYYEPGTINMLIMTNMRLSPRAMTRAVISATEAKTAALMDMDIRSAYAPAIYQATGTGTDNIIVAAGTGTPIHNAGGHSKMGELVASAVHGAVTEAVYRQNGIVGTRNIFQRLKDRRISVYGLLADGPCDCDMSRSEQAAAAEALLLDPAYAGFLAAALAIGDAHRQGLAPDLSAFNRWALQVAETVAGTRIAGLKPLVAGDNLPEVEATALNAIVNGVYYGALAAKETK